MKKPSHRKTKEQYVLDCRNIHGDKYDYSTVDYTNAHAYITITCKTHGPFVMKAYCHLQGQNCPKCSGNYKQTTEEFVAKSVAKYPGKFTYEKTVFEKVKTQTTITCVTHGDFQTTPGQHLKGFGCCPGCYSEHMRNINRKKTTEQFVKEATEKHNGRYDYSNSVYTGAHQKLAVTCRIHGDFRCTPADHVGKESGCPKCKPQISKVSNLWLDSLNNPKIIREYKLPENKLRRVDGYDPSTNTIYQFHGTYYHSDPRVYDPLDSCSLRKKTHGENYANSCRLDNELRIYGYNLVIMWEYDFLGGKRFRYKKP